MFGMIWFCNAGLRRLGFYEKEWLTVTHLTSESDEKPSWAIALRQQRKERVNVFDWLNILTNKRSTKILIGRTVKTIQ